MKNTTTISIDLAKNVFQVGVFNECNPSTAPARHNSRL